MTENSNSVRCTNCALLFLPPDAPRRTRTARVEELLRENHPPLDGELSAFRSDMNNTRAALQDLDVKIAQAKELLDNLFSARQQVELHLEDAKSLLHPLRSIPSELLVEIFSHCIPRVEIIEDTDSLDPRRAPWLLTRVCRRWRDLVINSPRLWTHLLIDVTKYTGYTELQYAHKAGLFIERSRGLPMAVYLGSPKPVSNQLLAVLERGIPRWRLLSADIPQSSLQRLFENAFSNLRKLVVLSNEGDGSDLDLDGLQPSRVPILRELHVLSSESWEDLESVVAFPWSQLTSLGNFPPFDVNGLNHLRMMTNLEALGVVVEGYDFTIHTPIQDVIALPKLRRLTIRESNNATGRAKAFFAALNIPALAELLLTFSEDDITLFPTSTSTLGNLTKLDISCDMDAHGGNTQHFLDFLALTHRVEWLRIYDLTVTVKFVNGLNLSNSLNGASVRLPHLHFLDIGKCECVEALANDLNPLVNMLYSRLPGVCDDATKGGEKTHHQSLVKDSATRSRLDSNFLKTVQLPRRVYVEMRRDRPDTFLEMSRKVKLECGVTTNDDPY